MKKGIFLLFVLILMIPAGVIADPGDRYPGMMGYWQNDSGQYYGPGMMGYWQNNSGQYYGPGMMGNWQNNSGQYYGPGMMGNWQNNPGSYGTCPGGQYGMMNGWGYGYDGGMMFPFMGLMAVLVIIFAVVWTIAGILLIIWLHKKMQTK